MSNGFQKGNRFGYKPCSQEIRLRFSNERRGSDNPNWVGGKKIKSACLFCGQEKLDYVPRKYCSVACRAQCPIRRKQNSDSSKKRTGKLAPNWQGGKFTQAGLRGLKKYYWWRNSIFKIKGRKCESCGCKENLEIDHIRPLALIIAENKITTVTDFLENPIIWEFENGRVLCKKCHKNNQTSWKGLKKIKQDIRSIL